MIREALEFLFDAGKQSQQSVTVKTGPHSHATYIQGACHLWDDERLRSHTCGDMESFAAAVNLYVGDEAVVWIGDDTVIAILDDDSHGENYIEIKLTPSEEFKLLEGLPNSYSQKSLISWIKAGFSMDSKLLKGLRKVNFKRKSDGSKTVEHGQETLGRSVEAAVQGVDEIPEVTTLQVARYDMAVLRDKFPVELRITIDVEDESFYVSCGPNELALLNQRAKSMVKSYLECELQTAAIYLGKP